MVDSNVFAVAVTHYQKRASTTGCWAVLEPGVRLVGEHLHFRADAGLAVRLFDLAKKILIATFGSGSDRPVLPLLPGCGGDAPDGGGDVRITAGANGGQDFAFEICGESNASSHDKSDR